MTEFIKYIIGLFAKFQPTNQILLVLFIGGLAVFSYGYLKVPEFRRNVNSIFNLIIGRKKISLLNHDIFIKQSWLLNLANKVEFDCTLKTRLFQILLQIKIDETIQLTKKFITENNFNKLDNITIYDKYIQLLNDIELNFENKLLKDFIKELQAEKGATAFNLIFHNAEIGVKQNERENINHIRLNLEKITYSNILSQKQKVFMFLNLLYSSLELSCLNCEKTFKDLNGQLKKLDCA